MFKRHILELNYCLYQRLGSTTLLRDDSTLVLNSRNPGHQQSNLCFRIRLPSVDSVSFDTFFNETLARFHEAGVTPRYMVDELATPSIGTLQKAFESRGFHCERDVDVIMARAPSSDLTTPSLLDNEQVRQAGLADVDPLTDVFAAAFGYGDSTDWLRYKLTCQLQDPDTFPIFVTLHDRTITSAVILNLPRGLPLLGHVNTVATHPRYQRQHMAAKCLAVALQSAPAAKRTMYLEVYEDIKHAQKLYASLGFCEQGTLDTFSAYKK